MSSIGAISSHMSSGMKPGDILPQAAESYATESYMALSKKSMASVGATAKDFEAMMASQMLSPMMNTVEVDGMFGGGEGEEAFRGFLVQEYGRIAAERGAFGIADQMKAMVLQMQSIQSPEGAIS